MAKIKSDLCYIISEIVVVGAGVDGQAGLLPGGGGGGGVVSLLIVPYCHTFHSLAWFGIPTLSTKLVHLIGECMHRFRYDLH